MFDNLRVSVYPPLAYHSSILHLKRQTPKSHELNKVAVLLLSVTPAPPLPRSPCLSRPSHLHASVMCITCHSTNNVRKSGGGGAKWRASAVPGLCHRSCGGAVRTGDSAAAGPASNRPRQDRRLHAPSSGRCIFVRKLVVSLPRLLSSPRQARPELSVPGENLFASTTFVFSSTFDLLRQHITKGCAADIAASLSLSLLQRIPEKLGR